MIKLQKDIDDGRNEAFIICKDAISNDGEGVHENNYKMVHVIINTEAMSTVVGKIELVIIAKDCGYPNAVHVDNFQDLDRELVVA